MQFNAFYTSFIPHEWRLRRVGHREMGHSISDIEHNRYGYGIQALHRWPNSIDECHLYVMEEQVIEVIYPPYLCKGANKTRPLLSGVTVRATRRNLAPSVPTNKNNPSRRDTVWQAYDRFR